MKPSRKVSPSRWPFVLVGAGLVLLILVIVLALAPPVSAPTPTPARPVVVAASEIPRVGLDEAKAAFDAGSAVFLDVRDAGSYETAHVAGAESIPFVQLDDKLNKLDKARWIITYCT